MESLVVQKEPLYYIIAWYVIHGESTKGFTYTFGQKTSPGMGMGTDDPWDPDPYPSGPGIRTSPERPESRFGNVRKSGRSADKAFVIIQIQASFLLLAFFIMLDALLTSFSELIPL